MSPPLSSRTPTSAPRPIDRRTRRRPALAALLLVLAAGASAAPLPLETIMADPDWIGAPAREAYWGADGRAVYYTAKRPGSPLSDLHRIELGRGTDQVVEAAAMAGADGPPIPDPGRRRVAFVRQGDVYVRELGSGRLIQVTRTAATESAPQFSSGGRLSFRVDNDWYVWDEAARVVAPAAVVRAEKDPDAAPKPDDLRDVQLRTFTTLKKLHDDAETKRHQARDDQAADTSRVPVPFYLGEDVAIADTSLSPDGRWLLVVTRPKDAAVGFEGKLTRYVTESGYEEFEKERTRVGRNRPAGQALVLLDLADHTMHPLSFEPLPGLHDDPLAAIRAENGLEDPKPAAGASATPAGPPARPLEIKPPGADTGDSLVRWSRDGHNVAIVLRALDHKDRWIATVDFATHALVPRHRLSDPAWIDWDYNDLGWLNDDRTLWYQSEETGFAQLYVLPPSGPARALTTGRFEVTDVQLSTDGRWFYVRANAEGPADYDIYRLPSAGGALTRVTRLRGVKEYALDGEGRRLLVTHSSSYVPPRLALVAADGTGEARELTDPRTPAYRAIPWLEPEFVELPSTHGAGTLRAKLYRDPNAAPGPRPAVLFVHGAGYTQDVHRQFPYYFREQMFHNRLVAKGYVVLVVDYRASQGYGRDWRTAIYRQMGTPELEDLLDAKRWLVATQGVDPKRVGIYGGSYGGFMTLMALFKAPGEFAAGAALRPVTDWMQYEHDYTSSILNEPQVDPLAYRRSSPMEFAAGLADPLLIAHGVLDDNVLFEDSMRLYQRLIELHKDRFTISPYALDRHGFTNADSWLDEYKRIDALFDATLHPPGATAR